MTLYVAQMLEVNVLHTFALKLAMQTVARESQIGLDAAAEIVLLISHEDQRGIRATETAQVIHVAAGAEAAPQDIEVREAQADGEGLHVELVGEDGNAVEALPAKDGLHDAAQALGGHAEEDLPLGDEIVEIHEVGIHGLAADVVIHHVHVEGFEGGGTGARFLPFLPGSEGQLIGRMLVFAQSEDAGIGINYECGLVHPSPPGGCRRRKRGA